MRACLLALAALALARPPPAAPAASPAPRLDPLAARHIKAQILAKLGLTSRPTPLGAPPRDVVRRILARAADPRPPPPEAMREIIAIAHRDFVTLDKNQKQSTSKKEPQSCFRSQGPKWQSRVVERKQISGLDFQVLED